MRHEKKNRVMDDFKIWKNVLLDGDWERSMGGVGNQEFILDTLSLKCQKTSMLIKHLDSGIKISEERELI